MATLEVMDGTGESKALVSVSEECSEFVAGPAACPGPCCEGCMGTDEIETLEEALAFDSTMMKAILVSIDGSTIATADTESMEASEALDESMVVTVNATWKEALVFDTVVIEAVRAPVAESTVTGEIEGLEGAHALDSTVTEAVVSPVDATVAFVSSPAVAVGEGSPEEGQPQSVGESSADHLNPGENTDVAVNAVEPTLFFPALVSEQILASLYLGLQPHLRIARSYFHVGDIFAWEFLRFGRNFQGFSLPAACLWDWKDVHRIWGFSQLSSMSSESSLRLL